jgi:hypothetical protein
MPTKISNTNTNINRININIPKQRNAKITPKSVGKAEQDLQNLETQDRQLQYSSQAPSQFINPSVFGFNTTPIQNTIPMERQTEELITSPQMTIAEPINRSDFMPQRGDTPREPIPFRSSSTPVQRDVLAQGYSQPEYMLNKPSDFPERLARQEGFQPYSSTSAFAPLTSNRMRDIQKQGRPDINEMAQNVKEAYRGSSEKQAGSSPVDFGVDLMSIQEALPPAKKGKGGRPVGSKNKPKPISIDTQTGASLVPEDLSLGTQFAEAKRVPKPKGALRGQKDD